MVIKNVERAAVELSTARVDATAFADTASSFYKGPIWDKELKKRIEQVSGVPSTTTSTVVLEAFNEFGLKKITVVTPCVPILNRRLKMFLEGNGLNVVNIEGLSITDGLEIANQSQDTIYNLATKANKKAEGILISCTNFPTMEIIERLESDLEKPVFTANQATFWAALKMASFHEPIHGYGKLLRTL